MVRSSTWSQQWSASKQVLFLLYSCITLVLLTSTAIFTVTPSSTSSSSLDNGSSSSSGSSGLNLGSRASSLSRRNTNNQKLLGAIVLLAPPRKKQAFGVSRFCLLMRAVRTVDQHLNRHYGPYPIYILVAKDHALEGSQDGPYTAQDRALLRSWVSPNTTVVFKEINLYSADALEPQTSRQQILEWIRQVPERKFKSLGYRSMCRLWSGRVQQFDWLAQRYQYYLRMDDDSMLVEKPDRDPFQHMQERQLQYYYRRSAMDAHGKDELYNIALPHLERAAARAGQLPDLLDAEYDGAQPYNNFHISSLAFWNSPAWKALFQDLDRHHIFFQHSVGDANIHYMANLMMPPGTVHQDPDFPYRHNINDMWGDFVSEEFVEECKMAGVGS